VKEKGIILEKLKENENFTVNHQFEGEGIQLLVIDEDGYLFAYLNGKEDCRIYSISNILDVDLLVEDERKFRTSHGISTSGAIIGGEVGGGVGAVIGGFRKKYSLEDNIKKIYLHIVVDDTKSPNIIFDIFKGTEKRTSSTIKEHYSKAIEIYDLLTFLIKKAS
jgi:hypothetical protein